MNRSSKLNWWFLLFFKLREAVAKTDEGVSAPVSGGTARLRFFSMKRTVSQQSFDGVSVDSGGPEDRISVDSDGSDGFVMLLESGVYAERCVSPGSACTLADVTPQGSSRAEIRCQRYFPNENGREEIQCIGFCDFIYTSPRLFLCLILCFLFWVGGSLM